MIGESIREGRPLYLLLVGCILPWCVLLLTCSGLITLINFLGLLLMLTGLGYLVLAGIDGAFTAGDRMLLSPAAGYVVACGVLAIATRLGCSAGLTFWAISIVSLIGIVLYGRGIRSILKTEVSLGVLYVGLSALVCMIYFLPGALRDAVLLKNGAFNSMYVDTQYSMAVAACVKTSTSVPKWPGLGIANLEYHFGPYALSGALSAATGIELADAYARVVRGAAQLILLASTIATSRILSRQAGNVNFAGLMGAVGLFFYGSLGSLFADRFNPSTLRWAPISLSIPFISLPGEGGPFSHIVLGHSLVFGMIGINVVVSILLAKTGIRATGRMGPDVSCLLPGFVSTVNGIAGLGACGVYVGTMLILGRKHLQAIAACLIASVFFIVVLKVMGYVGSTSLGHMEINKGAAGLLFEVFVWTFIGLGFRVFALKWMKSQWGSAACVTLLLFVLGYLSYGIGVIDHYDSHQLRAIRFLEPILSIFAFVALAEPLNAYLNRRKAELDTFWDDFMGFLFWCGALFLLAGGICYTLERILNHTDIGRLWLLGLTMKSSLIVIILSWLIRRGMKQNLKVMLFVKIAIMVVFLWGSLAWITPWLNYGIGRVGFDVQVSKGEVDGLRRLRDISKASDLFATNHQITNSTPLYQSDLAKKSPHHTFYSYCALLERRVLIEGWDYGEKYQPLFSKVQKDNDVLFNTSNPDEALSIVKRYHINFILARPGTDILISSKSCTWLRPLPNMGTLKVYEVLDNTL